METIDITQAIKDNATAVSNNLDVSVLEELLEFSNVFKYVTNNPSEPNLNNIKTNGIYFITNPQAITYINFPPMFTSDGSGTMKSPYAALKVYTNGNAILQECILYNGRTAVRHYNSVGKYWADWVEYSLT